MKFSRDAEGYFFPPSLCSFLGYIIIMEILLGRKVRQKRSSLSGGGMRIHQQTKIFCFLFFWYVLSLEK